MKYIHSMFDPSVYQQCLKFVQLFFNRDIYMFPFCVSAVQFRDF